MGIFGTFSLLLSIAALAALLFAIGFMFARLYKRATKEVSFVRTGFGGQKVVMNRGALVFPVLHDTIPVNMNTLRLAVSRRDEQALITRDRMRVDVVAEFYVRTKPTLESIANAAQTLGTRTMQPATLRDLVEGKFVDALRCVAAEMTMEELHEQRTDFIQKVQQAVTEDLLKNGLELETVSLTALDQTNRNFFNPDNAFDAEGLTRLTEEIERRRKIRNDIEQDTNMQIRQKMLEAEKQRLTLQRDEEYAKLEQEREIEICRASQGAEISRRQAEMKREAEQAEILAKQQVEESRILSEKAVQLAEQDRAIALADKSREQSEARAQADRARALAIQAEEQVTTAKEKEAADRRKQIELIQASQEAERKSIAIRIEAEAEKAAAADQAKAIRELAQAQADKVRIAAEGDADAEKLRVAAAEMRYAVEAEGQKALNEAANLLCSEQIGLKTKLSLIENLSEIIQASVKPLENIEGIKIIQMGGLAPHPMTLGGSPGEGNNLADQVMNSALKYRAQAPLVDSLLKELGLNGGDLNGLTQPFKGEAKEC